MTLGAAWELAEAFGLNKLALRLGAPKFTPGIDVETVQQPWQAHTRVYLSASGATSGIRQSAYMDNALRPTVRTPPADPAAWPWPLAHVVAGASAPPERYVVDRSVFLSIDTAAAAAATAAAAARQPPGTADARALCESIRTDMRRQRREETGLEQIGGMVGGQWVTPGAGPMQPSPVE